MIPRWSVGGLAAAMKWGPAWIWYSRQRRAVLTNFADGPAGLVLDPPADGQGDEDDGQVRFDGVPQVVVDGAGLLVGVHWAGLDSAGKRQFLAHGPSSPARRQQDSVAVFAGSGPKGRGPGGCVAIVTIIVTQLPVHASPWVRARILTDDHKRYTFHGGTVIGAH